MQDFVFGNRLYEFRSKMKLSQREVANYVGVSDKAVSKWENGKAKPTIDVLRKLAVLYQVSIEELLKLRESQHKAVQVHKIVVTGGPCGGKSTAMSWIQNNFEQLGYRVLFVSEAASELITGGIAPWNCADTVAFQSVLMELQLKKEELFEKAARGMDVEKVLIVCDRGALDSKAYMSELEFHQMLERMHLNEVELRDHYDAVFHLVSAAKGAEAFYTLENNAARTETIEEASLLDDKTIGCWTGHPHLRVIDNQSGFEDKMRKLMAEIAAFLGEPQPMEIERKFLIEYPDIKWLESLPNCQRVEIIQTYLKSDDQEEVRVRQRGINGNYIYFKTTKKKMDGMKRIELERRLSQNEYLQLLMEADTQRRQIRKDRYCLTYDNQYFEIDIYPFWKHQAIMEIELRDENQVISFPQEIKVIKEVTDDPAYKNAQLAKR